MPGFYSLQHPIMWNNKDPDLHRIAPCDGLWHSSLACGQCGDVCTLERRSNQAHCLNGHAKGACSRGLSINRLYCFANPTAEIEEIHSPAKTAPLPEVALILGNFAMYMCRAV
jgi:hypothetical protein